MARFASARARFEGALRWLRIPANAAVTLALGGLLAFAGAHAWSFNAFDIDDAYITFRYADNLAHGLGFVFNPGERVEGTSTFLETIVLAILRLFGAELLIASRVIGVGSLFALILGAFVLVRSLAASYGRALGLGAAALVASSMPLAVYAMSGLETNLFAALLLLGVGLHLRAAGSPLRDAKAWSLAMGAVALTRPEGVGYFGLLWGCAVLRDAYLHVPPRVLVRRAAVSIGWFALVYGPLVLFRGVYFHALVPNTVTAKAHLVDTFHGKRLGEILQALVDGAGGRHFNEYAAMLGIGAYLVPLGLLGKKARYATSVLLGVVFASLAVDALDDGDWMPAWRLLTPAVAPLAVLVALGLGAVLFKPDQRVWRTQLASVLVATVVFASAATHLYPGGVGKPSPQEAYRVWLAGALAPLTRDDDVLATDMAGVIPYVTHMRTIDMNGLCDREIALHGKPLGTMGKIDRPSVIRRRPTFFQPNFVSEMRNFYDDPTFAPMRGDYYAVITDGYRKGLSLRERKILVVRKDRPGVNELAAALGAQLVDLGQELKAER